ncbi:tripartite tricarboxylate transporter substrate binding protein [Pseudorhodoplanes sp.]|uniref:Bug family tripartite tricarboxylate transporter substrate binding protein n=1 Tax=Pseudorhodoplanes sp. TaxID=1934341 RepID=UPI002B99B8C4|nr:tripartite tricarboxylate transporter substrate binding protein [Pseudorhodoplanes sp.]HWV51642.1 tripartite tricarboxylate transporter substrate binding protein [Pseudorhodoplanes sp.]
MRKLFLAAASLLAASSAIVGITAIASAQTFPSRPVTLVVPFPPGGVIDTTARVIESGLAKELGQPVVIENKGGSGGNLGTQFVARAQPDGHTILMVPNATVVMNPYTFKSYPIDPGKDLTGVGMVGETYLGLVVPANSPFNTVQDIVAAAKAKPGELTYAHIGPGSAHNIAGALLNKKAGINITPVPFQGAGPALQSLLGGHISMSYATIAGIMPYIESKQMKLIALAEPGRIKKMPNAVTMNEVVPGVEVTSWVGVFAPAGTPRPVVDRLNTAMNKVLAMPEVQAKLDRIGVVPTPGTAAAFDKRVQEDLKFWKGAIELAGITPQ